MSPLSDSTPAARAVRSATAFLALALFAAPAAAQNVRTDSLPRDTVFKVDPIVVTATRSPKPVFVTPAPATVIDNAMLRRTQANTITDVFRQLPGMDVNGVGVQQPRPIIRGQRGQRILLLQDGLRLNNSRRQQDFGEVPALIDVAAIDRVEVVRGPASVLYGTDAIGGVVNIITRRPGADGVHGSMAYRYGAEEEQHRGTASLFGRAGRFDFDFVGSVRDAGAYRAPAGTFGDIELAEDVRVNATGVEDWSATLRLGYALSDRHDVFVRAERYAADGAGFGFVDPADYAPDQPMIDIRYPEQRFWKTTFGWSGRNLQTALVDRVDVMGYVQDNERRLAFDLFTSFGPQAPPGAGVDIDTRNFTDLRTVGARIEAKKLVATGVLVTYGVDGFRDASENTDSSLTTILGFGPPMQTVSTTPQVPNATYRSLGAFVQGEFSIGERATLTAGGRVQDVRAEADPIEGLHVESKAASTAVGAVNLLYELTDRIALIGSVGRAFRAPNLIEWFFDGPTPEGNGYQLRSPDLEPEKALSLDAGVRYRDGRFALEAFAFRNKVTDGIRIAPTGEEVEGLPAYRNVNVEELVFRGIELSGEVRVVGGLMVDGSYTRLETEDALDPSNPIGDSFSSKLTGGVRYTDPGDRYWFGYDVRHNGERKDVALSENPVGDVLPSFTVHALRAGATLWQHGRLTPRIVVAVENLTNELYAESSNVSFFRPEPRRRLTVQWSVGF